LLPQGVKSQLSGHPAQIHLINLNSSRHRRSSGGGDT